MKKYIIYVLVVMMCMMLTACGKKITAETTTQETAMSWQEQYDLGIRLLAEGKYEEAILTFQAVIQIDPKRSEAYGKLADAYIGAGDYEKAASVLAEGYKVTGETSLEEKRKEVQAQIDAMQTSEDPSNGAVDETTGEAYGEQLTSPLEVPELPDVLNMDYMTTPITYVEEEYVVFDEDTMAIWAAAVEAGLNDDREALSTALDAIDVERVKTFSTIYNDEYYDSVTGWTMWQGALLGYACNIEPDWSVQWTLEYRPVEGTGFTAIWIKRANGSTREFWIGDMSQHVYEGAFRHTYEELQLDGAVYATTTTGGASQELYHGDLTIRQEGLGDQDSPAIVLYYRYENGIMQLAWEDPSIGEMCHAKRVEIWPDGREDVTYLYFGDSDMICYVTGFLGGY